MSDETLDLTHNYLQRMAELYRQGPQRKLTPRELAKTLEICLTAAADDVLEGGETLSVRSVLIKTAKKPRKQQFAPGDIFVVDLGEQGYAFGRIMAYTKSFGAAIEFFRQASQSPVWQPSIAASGRLFPPIFQGRYVFDDWEWRVVANDPDYAPSDDDMRLEFEQGGAPQYWTTNIANETVRSGLTKDDVSGLPTAGRMAPKWIAERIRAALEGRPPCWESGGEEEEEEEEEE